MKRRFVKIFKGFSLFIGILLIIITAAVLWPMPTIEAPKKNAEILIKSIDIIDVRTGEVLRNRDVLIEGNLIKSIDTIGIIKVAKSIFTINGKGKYMIPGLWDMHTHSNHHSPWLHHPLYIANGVTGVREMSGTLDKKDSYWVGSNERLKWNNDLLDNKRITPRYVLQSSYQIDGKSSVPCGFPSFFRLENTNDIPKILDFYRKENVDFIKVYQQIKPDSYRKLAAEAPKYGIHLAGHKPMFLSLKEAIHLGQKSFEHGRIFMFESFPKADSLKNPDNWKEFYSKSKKSITSGYDESIAIQLMELMKEKNAYWTPTLQTLKFEANAHKEQFLYNPNLKYVTQVRKKLWWGIDANNNKKRNVSAEGKNVSKDFYKALKIQVKKASDIGVPIMTGTDVTDSYTFAGFSVHDELYDLTESGLSNLDALQTATIVPAQYANLQTSYGSIEVGKMADLIILNDNPLENIKNSKKINAVLLNGVLYDSKKIRELKEFTESIASSFHINVKAFKSLIGSPLIRVQFAD
ncbi:amidohydrolase family protein [Tenacibaculum retecalamus]|uniref:amidohydrolase family protein n=1 Tax=Tenacibaculum retecalamus TaxID=3018315 RepID=UPI0023D93103|nr:amidohydrolase family protein [Tenacibaculum retecalamus]WBX71055.1 amidohydrolase family protein [Tenacibaculum retecalamus]